MSAWSQADVLFARKPPEQAEAISTLSGLDPPIDQWLWHLRELERRGIEIGAHSRTHRSLPELSDADLTEEVQGAVRDLEAGGREAAFGVVPGRVRRDSARFRLPRIEIRSGDTGFSLLLRVAFAVDLEVDWRRFRLRRWSRRLVGVVRRKRPAIG